MTTSTSFMSCTGLKKCSPSICFGRPQKAAILCTARLEVLDAMTQPSETSLHTSRVRWRRAQGEKTRSALGCIVCRGGVQG